MASASDAYAAPALERGLDVLELLCERGQMAKLSEIAAALRLSRNQIFRVVHVLEARGYLLRDGDHYATSNRMFQLAARRPPFVTLIDFATPEMRTLAAKIGQSFHITIQIDTRTVVIARIENPNAISIALPLGHNLPIHKTASGRAILAMLPPSECNKLIARLAPRGERQLRVQLARIRARSYEISPGVRTLGVIDLSFPIFDATSWPVGCLAVPLLRKRPADVSIERLLPLSRAAAGRISSALATLRLRIDRRPGRCPPRSAQTGGAIAGSSARMHATIRPSTGRRAGRSAPQRSIANGQRPRSAQPDGGSSGEGISPRRRSTSGRGPGRAEGVLASNARV